MRLCLIWVGRTRDRNISAAIDCYLDRIARYVPVDAVVVKEQSGAGRHTEAGALRAEGLRLREKIPPACDVVVLDPGGREMTSPEFARFLEGRLGRSSTQLKGMAFVVGGHLGLDEETKKIADHTVALSRMTLTHEMARLVAVEQIYRGLSIIHGSRYHRG